jgi:hypothetical protein
MGGESGQAKASKKHQAATSRIKINCLFYTFLVLGHPASLHCKARGHYTAASWYCVHPDLKILQAKRAATVETTAQ